MTEIKCPKKLIEVALPLDDINAAAAREKSIRHGHPSTLHLWWARRPLAAARAVLFAQLVNDPSGTIEGDRRKKSTRDEIEQRRAELFQIIRDLVKWENSNNERVLNKAREAILQSWKETCHINRNHPDAALLFDPEKIPGAHDPFAGGGAIPLEAQRLGLDSYASDLNPVAVMINKAMIEIPPRFAGHVPIGPLPEDEKGVTGDGFEDWSGARGFAEDVRRYGKWIRAEAFKKLGDLYPKVKITEDLVQGRKDLEGYKGQELTIIAWLWARTVKSPNPAYSHLEVPLASSFVLSSKSGREAWVEPIVDADSYHFTVNVGDIPLEAKAGTKASGRGADFKCLFSGATIDARYIRKQAQDGRLGQRLMAIVVEGKNGRIYIPPSQQQSKCSMVTPAWVPEVEFFQKALGFRVGNYGMTKWSDLFTPRQLVALAEFSDLVQKARQKAIDDLVTGGVEDDGVRLSEGGKGATAFGDALAVYLGFVADKVADYWSSQCSWHSSGEKMRNTFGRQAIPMVWDYAEANPFCGSSGNWMAMVDWTYKALANMPAFGRGEAVQADAAEQTISQNKVVSTDPPYYDNIGYADLSDFFYMWMRRSLREVYPNLFTTISVPKAEELVATPARHGGRKEAEAFFMKGMTNAMSRMAECSHPAFPVTIYYAFKQAETKGTGTSSTGWETFLEAVIRAGFSIVGTWPMRTELANRMRGTASNALASSIVLVCRRRKTSSASISRRDFQRELRETMPEALAVMIGGETGQAPIAPVDLAQAAIGPGIAIYSKYEAVLNQDGSRMSVHDALVLINRSITDYLSPDSGSFDADTQFCSSWFEQYGWSASQFGEADTLARAKGTSVDGVKAAGVVESGSGKVRLLKWSEYESDWDPTKDDRTPVWEACHQMIRRLNKQGESAAGELLAKMPEKGEAIRQLTYHLYALCERKKWAEDARAYNELIGSWNAIVSASHEVGHKNEQQGMDF